MSTRIARVGRALALLFLAGGASGIAARIPSLDGRWFLALAIAAIGFLDGAAMAAISALLAIAVLSARSASGLLAAPVDGRFVAISLAAVVMGSLVHSFRSGAAASLVDADAEPDDEGRDRHARRNRETKRLRQALAAAERRLREAEKAAAGAARTHRDELAALRLQLDAVLHERDSLRASDESWRREVDEARGVAESGAATIAQLQEMVEAARRAADSNRHSEEVEGLRRDLASRDAELTGARTELERVSAALAAAQSQLVSTSERLVESERLVAEAGAAAARAETVAARVAELERQNDRLQRELGAEVKELAAALARNGELAALVRTASTEMEALREREEEQHARLATLSERLREREGRLNALAADRDSAQTALASGEEQLAALRESAADAERRAAEAEGTIAEISARLTLAERDNERLLAEGMDAIDLAAARLSDLETSQRKVEELEARARELTSRVAALEASERESVTAEVSEAEQRIAELEAKLATAHAALQVRDADVEQAALRIEELSEELRAAATLGEVADSFHETETGAELQAAYEALAVRTVEVEQANARLEELWDKVRRMNSELGRMEISEREQEITLAAAHEELAAKAAALAVIREELRVATAEAERAGDLATKLVTAAQERETIARHLSDANALIESQTAEEQTMTVLLRELQDERDGLLGDISNLSSENARLTESLSTAEKRLTAAEAEIARLVADMYSQHEERERGAVAEQPLAPAPAGAHAAERELVVPAAEVSAPSHAAETVLDIPAGGRATVAASEGPRQPRVCDLTTVPVARTIGGKITGLLGKKQHEDLFLFIPDCAEVHTWFMRSPIDVVFLGEGGKVVAIHQRVEAWRVVRGPRGTRSVLELPPDYTRTLDIAVDDEVLCDRSGLTADGSLQRAETGARFGAPLRAKLTDVAGGPVADVVVTFEIIPGPTGAGGRFAAASRVRTSRNGVATSPLLFANDIPGTFSVVAKARTFSVRFELTNIPATHASARALGEAAYGSK